MAEKNEHPRVLIEEWFPFTEVGIECERERGMSSALPAIYFIHVWWARRPLSVSRAAILASILPADFSQNEFKDIMGFSPTLLEEYKKISKAKKEKVRLSESYRGDRIFKKHFTEREKNTIKSHIESLWKKGILEFLDPMSGGGSIPFEAVRIGLNVNCSDLNPVAVILLFSTIQFPLKFKKKIISKVESCKNQILEKCAQLLELFPIGKEKEIDAFLWVRTVKCPNPECNLNVPLSPNWDLAKNPRVINKIIVPRDGGKDCTFQVIENPTKEDLEKNTPTVTGGIGTCPNPKCRSSITSEYIRNEAQAGRMSHQLMAVVYKQKIEGGKKEVRQYRQPTKADYDAIHQVDLIVTNKLKKWHENGVLPEEIVPEGAKTRELLNKGINKWFYLFNNRQLLANLSILEEIIALKKQLLTENNQNSEESIAIITLLQLALNKILNYNSIQSNWHPTHQRIANAFDRHDFAFSWSYAEMDIIRRGFDWAVKNVLKAYKGLFDLLGDSTAQLNISAKPAQKLDHLKENSIDVIIIDPPYYDNVMYAELSDFFYVWMRRGIGDLYPELFRAELTDKDNEAVANASKFEDMGKSKKALAKQDYEAKMRKAFQEMFRVLQRDGVLTIMFTHKATEAWDTLAMSLMDAGFEITASWPVHTEADTSLHIAKKNAVKTTILLVCRKRMENLDTVWWEDDVLPKIKEIARKKAEEFQKQNIRGVDLSIACFGPTLHEFSKHYPVKDLEGNPVRAEQALEVTRAIVNDFRFQKIINDSSVNVDPVSKYYLMAWENYEARIFPYDEARKLALSVGPDIEDLKNSYHILTKKAGDVELLTPTAREKNGFLDLEKPNDYGILVNAVHLAMLAYQQGGQKSYDRVVAALRRDSDRALRLYMAALYNILPDVKDLEEKKMLGEILVSTAPKIVPKGGKIDDFFKQN